jgi:hypothetical protein
MRKIKAQSPYFILLSLFLAFSCEKEEKTEVEPYGYISFTFLHKVDGTPLVIDLMQYVNAAGNQYLVNEIQYFISDVTLHRPDGSSFVIDDFKDIHYVDTDLEETRVWQTYDHVPAGAYSSISFTFGITGEKNHSLMFVNPPESLMFWPEYLGGGYHYMKLNGKWLDSNQQISPFDFHLGIGQVYDSTGQITGFIHNAFEVALPASSFNINEKQWTDVELIMNIERWFKSPHVYDHNIWGGDIMQKQEAMHLACENGHDVFTVNILD